MSLVVSLKLKSSVFLVADTKISFIDRKANPYLEGIAKISLLNESTCVAFAGNVEPATDAINKLTPNSKIKDILSLLAKASSHCSDIEFIVATLSPAKIWLIKNGSTEERVQAWIGDEKGFREYQSYSNHFNNIAKTNTVFCHTLRSPENVSNEVNEAYFNMISSMRATIESQKANSVGGFTTPVMTRKGKFEYGGYLSMYRRAIEEREIPSTGVAILDFSDEKTGSFSVNFAGQNTKCFATYILQGKIGVIFDGGNTNTLKPSKYSDIDEIDFVAILSKKYNGTLCALMSHNLADYIKNAQNHFKNRDFRVALVRLNKGISKHKGSLSKIPSNEINNLFIAFYTRGRCYLNLKKYPQALNDFKKALDLSPLNYDAMYWKSTTEYYSGNIEKAANSAKDCCAHHKELYAFDLCIKLLQKVGKNQEAERYFREAQSIALKKTNPHF